MDPYNESGRSFDTDLLVFRSLFALNANTNLPISTNYVLTTDGVGGANWQPASGGGVSDGELVSTVIGLGSAGYLSTLSNLVSTPFLNTTLQSTIKGLGSAGYLSTLSNLVSTPFLNTTLESTIKGLGSVGYLSTLSNLVSTPFLNATLQSTIKGLGSAGYLSTVSFNDLVSTPFLNTTLESTIKGLGSAGYLSSLTNLVSTPFLNTTLQSTIKGLGSAGYLSTVSFNDLVSTPFLNTTLESTVRGLGSAGYLSTTGSNLPTASQYGNYLFYNGNDWITGSTIVSIGDLAGGASNQGPETVAIGSAAGYFGQSTNSIAVGYQAGYTSQNSNSVAIGPFAGYSNQGVNTVAIGNDAGLNNQGDYAIAIGNQAGTTGQSPSSIILNASSANLEAPNSGFYVQPIRNDDTLSNSFLQYDTITGEIVYNAVKTFVIDHPTSASKYLVHACLEGAEAGVYYRGKGEVGDDGHALVNLPSYVDAFATDLTVNVTPIYNGNIRTLNATEVCSNQFNVFGNPGPFHWHVYGKRQSIIVEPEKSNVELKGSGPYKWLA